MGLHKLIYKALCKEQVLLRYLPKIWGIPVHPQFRHPWAYLCTAYWLQWHSYSVKLIRSHFEQINDHDQALNHCTARLTMENRCLKTLVCLGRQMVQGKAIFFVKSLSSDYVFMLFWREASHSVYYIYYIYLHSIFEKLQFEISSLLNWIFSLFQTWILQATAGRKIQFKLGEKNPFHQTRYFKTGELEKSSADR